VERQKITMRRPDDFHDHLREEAILEKVIHYTTDTFARAVAMGNLMSPIRNGGDVCWYKQRIINCSPSNFIPIMSVMLTKRTTIEDVRSAWQAGAILLKMIPEGVSTNSQEGIKMTELKKYYPILREAERLGMVFSGHWELSHDPKNGWPIHPALQEEKTIPFLAQLVEDFPGLPIVVEHASTRKMIEFVKSAPSNVGATLTAHHALYNYQNFVIQHPRLNDVETFMMIHPDKYCKPIIKSPDDMDAVLEAMFSGNPKFFYGSDSAPHTIQAKRSIPVPAGIFNPFGLEILADVFYKAYALDKMENFFSEFGVQHYGLPLNEGTITLIQAEWDIPTNCNGFFPFYGGKKCYWKIER
jgi:dihydroorotase